MIRDKRVDDNWKWINNARIKGGVEAIIIREGCSLKLNCGSHALIGKNGSRKTQLLRKIHNQICSEETNRPCFVEKSQVFDNIEVVLDDSSERELVSLFFDPCALIPALDAKINSDTNIDDFRDASGYREVDSEGLRWISYLTGNIYESIKISSVEDSYDDFPRFPLFDLSRSGVKYSSGGMGYGEHSLLYCFWLLELAEDISNDGKSVVLIIEEPESFISPFFQKRLVNFIASKAKKSKIQLLIVSHSEHVVERFNQQRVAAIRWDKISSDFAIEDDISTRTLRNELGILKRYKYIIFVEDFSAQAFLVQILNSLNNPIYDDIIVVQATNGESSVEKIREHISPDELRVKFNYVFDGDHQVETETRLPGGLAPERVILNWLKSLSPLQMAQAFNSNLIDAESVFSRHTGADHHEYLRCVSNDLGREFPSFFKDLCFRWVDDPSNESDIIEFVKKIEIIIN